MSEQSQPSPRRPGNLREAHAHLPWHGLALSMPRLDRCTSVDDCLQLVAAESDRLRRASEPGWLLASGARVASWTGHAGPRWPAREELDRVCDRPCALMSFDHHSLAANTAAMHAAGLHDDSPDPPGGVIVRETPRGRPTGVFLESAAQRIWSAAPEPTIHQRRAQLRAALADLASHGFTEVHDLLAPDWLGPELAALDDAGLLPMEVHLFAPLDRLEHQARAAASPRGWSRPRVRLAGGKIFADGTLNSRTAWMLQPYKDPLPDHPTGKALMDARAIAGALDQCSRLNLSLAVHAIGDAAVRAALDAYDLFISSSGASAGRASSPRSSTASLSASVPSSLLRIEHAELIDEADIPRFNRPGAGLVASLQPCHLLADIEALERSLPHRLHRVLPIRDLVGAGLAPGRTLLFGSDVPVVRADPQDSITAATLRQRTGAGFGGATSRAIAPDQSIDEAAAWACFARV